MRSEDREWAGMDTAPLDGTHIQVKIPGYGEDNIIAWRGGFLDSEGEDTGGWCYISGGREPECWTDGVCWALNDNNQPSIQPTHWKLPSAKRPG